MQHMAFPDGLHALPKPIIMCRDRMRANIGICGTPITALSWQPRPSSSLCPSTDGLSLPRFPIAQCPRNSRNQAPIRHPPNDNHWRLSLNGSAVYDSHSREPHSLPTRSCLWELFLRCGVWPPLAMKNVHLLFLFVLFVAHSFSSDLHNVSFPCFCVGTSIDCFPLFPLPWTNT